MSIIRKLEPAALKDFCCDFNDVCEGEVTHKVTEDNGTNPLYYCCEHMDLIRESVPK